MRRAARGDSRVDRGLKVNRRRRPAGSAADKPDHCPAADKLPASGGRAYVENYVHNWRRVSGWLRDRLAPLEKRLKRKIF